MNAGLRDVWRDGVRTPFVVIKQGLCGLALLCCAALAAAAPPPCVPGQLIVKYKTAQTAPARAAVAARHAAYTRRSLLHGQFALWHLADTNITLQNAARIVSADPDIDYAEPNFIYSISRSPNDPLFADGSLWGLNNTGQFGGTVDADIDAPEAWDFTFGGDIIVGVVDSGVDYTHPDLAANMWRNPGEIPDDGIDNDGNGYVDDVFGIDTVNNTGDPYDELGHGTHCAGTIAGAGNNTQGVAGVCWRAQIMALKFIAGDGAGNAFGALACIEYAIHHGARVLNNSWGGGPYSQALQDMIALAEASNVLFCAAAGNGGRDGIGDNNDLTPDYPASYPNSNVLAVAASDRNDALAVFSNYGSNSVDVAAPGVDVVSTLPGNRYASYNGTSMATPHVCGAEINNSLIYANLSKSFGGGVYGKFGAVNNCTIVSNRAVNFGGGVFADPISIRNSIIYYNAAAFSTNFHATSFDGAANCVTPAIAGGGTMTNPPAFRAFEQFDLRLRMSSPCINAGSNVFAAGATDFAGQPRIVNGRVDIGAYEFALGAVECVFDATPSLGGAPLDVSFSAQVWSTNLAGFVCAWDFDNDGAIDTNGSALINVVHTYTNEGVYSVALYAMTPDGATGSYVRVNAIDVVPEPAGLPLLLALCALTRRITRSDRSVRSVQSC